jgi:hypothetical protein
VSGPEKYAEKENTFENKCTPLQENIRHCTAFYGCKKRMADVPFTLSMA